MDPCSLHRYVHSWIVNKKPDAWGKNWANDPQTKRNWVVRSGYVLSPSYVSYFIAHNFWSRKKKGWLTVFAGLLYFYFPLLAARCIRLWAEGAKAKWGHATGQNNFFDSPGRRQQDTSAFIKWPKWNAHVLGSVLSSTTASRGSQGSIGASPGSPRRESSTHGRCWNSAQAGCVWLLEIMPHRVSDSRNRVHTAGGFRKERVGTCETGKETEGKDKILINLPDWASCLVFPSGKCPLGLVRMEFQGSASWAPIVVFTGVRGLLEWGSGAAFSVAVLAGSWVWVEARLGSCLYSLLMFHVLFDGHNF